MCTNKVATETSRKKLRMQDRDILFLLEIHSYRRRPRLMNIT